MTLHAVNSGCESSSSSESSASRRMQAALQQSAEEAARVRAMDLAAAERLKREVAALRHEAQTLAAQLQVARVRLTPAIAPGFSALAAAACIGQTQ